MAQHNLTGTAGEKMAAVYLTGHGFSIICQNWRHRHWEIDLIASKDNVLHFIEVKTRSNTKYGYPEDGVSKKKLKFLIQASEEYMILNPGWKRIQFDILSILIGKNQPAEYFLIPDVYL